MVRRLEVLPALSSTPSPLGHKDRSVVGVVTGNNNNKNAATPLTVQGTRMSTTNTTPPTTTTTTTTTTSTCRKPRRGNILLIIVAVLVLLVLGSLRQEQSWMASQLYSMMEINNNHSSSSNSSNNNNNNPYSNSATSNSSSSARQGITEPMAATMTTEEKDDSPPRTTESSSSSLYPTSLIYDKTIYWDPHVPRLWLEWEKRQEEILQETINDDDAKNATNSNTTTTTRIHQQSLFAQQLQQPPAMILLTSYGWNQPNQTLGLQLQRHVRETELVTGVVNHPWFHPTFWNTVEQKGRHQPSDVTLQQWLNTTYRHTRFYVFLDVHTLFDSQYPIYGGYQQNYDTRHGRSDQHGQRTDWKMPLSLSRKSKFFTKSRLFQTLWWKGHNNQKANDDSSSRIRLMVYNSAGNGPPSLSHSHNRFNGTQTSRLPISLASYSALASYVNPRWDQGLPPPAVKPVQLNATQVAAMASCAAEHQRRFFVTYTGNGRNGQNSPFNAAYGGGARYVYFGLHDNVQVLAVNPYKADLWKASVFGKENWTYTEILSESLFGLAPRGDNKYSYRFTEVLSAGAIPVVHADDWLWPFRPELLDWKECAVIMPEKDAGVATLQVLRNMSLVERCQRRKRCYKIYKQYLETPEGVIRGLIEGLELAANRPDGPLPFQGVRCDAYNYSFDCNMVR